MTDHPDTDAILDDIDAAAVRLRQWGERADAAEDLTAGQAQQFALAAKAVLDNLQYLRHALDDGAPLPAAWAQAQQVNGPLGDLCEDAFTLLGSAHRADTAWWQAAAAWRARWVTVLAGEVPQPEPAAGIELDFADIHLAYLRQAAAAVDAMVSSLDVTALTDNLNEFHGKAAHLVGCVASLESMAMEGNLPAAWTRPWIARHAAEQRTDADAAQSRAGSAALDIPGRTPVVVAPWPPPWFGSVSTPARPPGFWGRIELPGMRSYTGWIEEAERFGTRGAVVRDWDGNETNFVVLGPNSPVYHLPVPQDRTGPGVGDSDLFGEGFGSGYRERDPY